MKQAMTIGCAVATAVLMGCSQNQVEIRNIAGGAVIFLFRGTQDSVVSGSNVTLGLGNDPIPNGSFLYSTTYEIPAGYAKSTADAGLSGTLTFVRNQTKQVLIYSSTYTNDSTGKTYEIHCNRSSNDPVSTGSSVSP